MAEGWARTLGGDRIEASSAGIEAHGTNPRAIAIMREAGVDISNQQSTRVTDEMIGNADIVVTVCGHADEHCPALPAHKQKIHWPLSDPAKATGEDDQINRLFRETRDDIRMRVENLLSSLQAGPGSENFRAGLQGR